MKARFTEAQIIQMIKEHEAREKTACLCRRHGINERTFYEFKSNNGDFELSDAMQFRALEAGNAKLKKLLAEQVLE